MSLKFSARTDCLHQNPEAFAALGVVTPRPVPIAECLDCAYTELKIAMNQSPSRPDLRWKILSFGPTSLATEDGWRIVLIRDHDRANATGYNATLAGLMGAAARHLNEVAYRLPLCEAMPAEARHFDDWEDAE